MGTPDLRGTPGTFSYYTNDSAFDDGSVPGGVVRRIFIRNHTMRSELEGPPNGFREKSPRTKAKFSVHIDPENPVAEVRIGAEVEAVFEDHSDADPPHTLVHWHLLE